MKNKLIKEKSSPKEAEKIAFPRQPPVSAYPVSSWIINSLLCNFSSSPMKDEFLSGLVARVSARSHISEGHGELPRRVQLFPFKNLWPPANYVWGGRSECTSVLSLHFIRPAGSALIWILNVLRIFLSILHTGRCLLVMTRTKNGTVKLHLKNFLTRKQIYQFFFSLRSRDLLEVTQFIHRRWYFLARVSIELMKFSATELAKSSLIIPTTNQISFQHRHKYRILIWRILWTKR